MRSAGCAMGGSGYAGPGALRRAGLMAPVLPIGGSGGSGDPAADTTSLAGSGDTDPVAGGSGGSGDGCRMVLMASSSAERPPARPRPRQSPAMRPDGRFFLSLHDRSYHATAVRQILWSLSWHDSPAPETKRDQVPGPADGPVAGARHGATGHAGRMDTGQGPGAGGRAGQVRTTRRPRACSGSPPGCATEPGGRG